MILVNNTPRNAGVTISGDYSDFEELYNALHEVVGEEGEFPPYSAARVRVLSLCYDLRHAMMGDREIHFVDNGLNQEVMKRLSIITSSNNVYFRVRAYWPEILFLCVALDQFIQIRRRKKKYPLWDQTIGAVQKFQAGIINCLRQTIPETSVKRTLNVLGSSLFMLDGYVTQYVDVLNCKFIAMDPDKRLKNISIMAKRITELSDEYLQFKQSVMEAAGKYNCPVEEIAINMEFPDEELIEW